MCIIYVSVSSCSATGLRLYFCLHAMDTARPLQMPMIARPIMFPSDPDKDINNPINEMNANKP